MNGSHIARPVFLVCVATAFAMPALLEAQLGGLLRGRITDEAKKAAGVPAEEGRKPAEAPAAAPVNEDPNVVPITEKALDAVEKGLQIEINLRGEFRKELAAMKSAEAYTACTQEVAASPEVLAISMRVAELPENAPPDAMQKLMAQNAQDMEALVLKRCGRDIRQVNRNERLRAIQRQAATAAGPLK